MLLLPDHRIRQRDYLLEIARALTQELDLDRLLDRILHIALEMLTGQAGLMALRSENKGWRVHVSSGLNPAFLKIVETSLADVTLNDDHTGDTEIPEISKLLQELVQAATMGLLTGYGLPLSARQQVVGVIFIFRSYTGIFSQNDRILLQSFADQAAVAVQNAQLYTQANEERQRINALLDSAADGILILSPDHRIQRFNPAFGRLAMKSPPEIQNRLHDEIIRFCTPPQGLTLEQAEAGGWPLTATTQLYVEGNLTRPEAPLPVGITYAPLLSQDGTLLNIIATVRDITRFRQAEELKSTFISIISHELKTPVALIKGYVSTLRREDATWDLEIIKDSLQVIEEEADHLTGLIENLLDASRLQSGGLSLKKADVDLVVMTRRLVERFQTQSSDHKVTMDFPPAFPVVLADEHRLEQVVSNLISNAIKYSPSGEIALRGMVRPETVVVCVSDQGPGIAPEDMPHVFERFYRAPDMARQKKGAGLGLYLARSIVEAHGGSIWIDPEFDRGTRVCFSLPR